jgi:hypothetical protein
LNESNDSNGNKVTTAGRTFAGGMKAEMNVTVYENVTVVADGASNNGNDSNTIHIANTIVNSGDLQVGGKYDAQLECKGSNLDCAGKTMIIPVSGHMTSNGWQGKVVKVSYGVFQTQGYDGPDTGVSVNELYGVTQSVFQNVVQSMNISGVTTS